MKTPPPPTKPGTQKLSDLARHFVLPTGIVATGWPAVRDKCLDLGVRFDPWQDSLGRAILAKRADGKYAAGVGGVVISIPRQVGKTYTVGAIVFALCILCPGLTVVWTAHRTRTAGETFRSMQGMAKRSRIAPFVEQVFTGSGDEEIRFRNGSRVLFGARERGFGRGFAEVDVEVFDEAQILTEKALDDMVPATNQSKQPTGALLFFIGTPPKPTDPGEAFTAKRAKAIAGTSTNMLYLELAADPDAKPDDRKQWAKANLSYPRRTPVEAMLRMRENLSDESFLREGLGVWDDLTVVDGISEPEWRACAATAGDISPNPVIAFDVALDRSRSSIGVAGVRADGRIQVELVEYRPGTAWVVERLVEMYATWGVPVTLDGNGPAAALVPDLIDAGVAVNLLTRPEVVQACGGMKDAVNERTLAHLDDPVLTQAVLAARLRTGESYVFTRKGDDISPLYAVTLARWVAATAPDYDLLASVH